METFSHTHTPTQSKRRERFYSHSKDKNLTTVTHLLAQNPKPTRVLKNKTTRALPNSKSLPRPCRHRPPPATDQKPNHRPIPALRSKKGILNETSPQHKLKTKPPKHTHSQILDHPEGKGKRRKDGGRTFHLLINYERNLLIICLPSVGRARLCRSCCCANGRVVPANPHSLLPSLGCKARQRCVLFFATGNGNQTD